MPSKLHTCLLLLTTLWFAGRGRLDAIAGPLDAHLRRMFPGAGIITEKQGTPPHFKILGREAGTPSLIGIGFLTNDVTPLERGYDGPINLLVGVQPDGRLAGVALIAHHEPYGSFSIETSQFAAEFKGKSIRDPFVVGKDIDAISRATITMNSATRAIKNGARRIAREVLIVPR